MQRRTDKGKYKEYPVKSVHAHILVWSKLPEASWKRCVLGWDLKVEEREAALCTCRGRQLMQFHVSYTLNHCVVALKINVASLVSNSHTNVRLGKAI